MLVAIIYMREEKNGKKKSKFVYVCYKYISYVQIY